MDSVRRNHELAEKVNYTLAILCSRAKMNGSAWMITQDEYNDLLGVYAETSHPEILLSTLRYHKL